jgi:hypothetical protein
MSETSTLKLSEIRTDGGTQMRARLNEAVVGDYARLYAEGVELPPIVVYCKGEQRWLPSGSSDGVARADPVSRSA